MFSVLIKSAKKFGIDKDKVRIQAIKSLKKRLDKSCELSIAFVSRAKIRELNRRYRKLDKPTSVLSFFQGQACPPTRRDPSDQLLLGDVVICPEIAKAQNLKVPFLVEHGIKNLLSEIPTAKNLRT